MFAADEHNWHVWTDWYERLAGLDAGRERQWEWYTWCRGALERQAEWQTRLRTSEPLKPPPALEYWGTTPPPR
jgi:hypothetical protein